MTAAQYHIRLGVILAAGGLVYLLLSVMAGARWTSFYGLATAALVTWPFVVALLWKRLHEAGRSRWWTLAYAVPVLVAALVQIGYWSAFFTFGPGNPTLGVMREMLRGSVGSALPWASAAVLALIAWVLWLAGRDRP